MKKATNKKSKTIKTPTGAAIIFILNSAGLFFSIFSNIALPFLKEGAKEYTVLEIIQGLIIASAMMVFGIILINKKYNKTLVYSSAFLLVSNIITLNGITISGITNVFFFLLLLGFTYVMVCMKEKPIRENIAKFRYILPIFFLITLLFSLLQTIQTLSDTLVNNSGAQLSESMSRAAVIVPSLLFIPSGVFLAIAYTLLVNWLVNPYKEK